jgi:hypothetical protein
MRKSTTVEVHYPRQAAIESIHHREVTDPTQVRATAVSLAMQVPARWAGTRDLEVETADVFAKRIVTIANIFEDYIANGKP